MLRYYAYVIINNMSKWKRCGIWGLLLIILMQLFVVAPKRAYAVDLETVVYNFTWRETVNGTPTTYNGSITFVIYEENGLSGVRSTVDNGGSTLAPLDGVADPGGTLYACSWLQGSYCIDANTHPTSTTAQKIAFLDELMGVSTTTISSTALSELINRGFADVAVSKGGSGQGQTPTPSAGTYVLKCEGGDDMLLRNGSQLLFRVNDTNPKCDELGGVDGAEKMLSAEQAATFIHRWTRWAFENSLSVEAHMSVAPDALLKEVTNKMSGGRYYLECAGAGSIAWNEIRIGYAPPPSGTKIPNDVAWISGMAFVWKQAVAGREWPEQCVNNPGKAVLINGAGTLPAALSFLEGYATEAGMQVPKNFEPGTYALDMNALRNARIAAVGDSNGDGITNEDDLYYDLQFRVDPCLAEAGALSWIVCPVIQLLEEAVTGIFGFIESMLKVDPRILDTQSETGEATYTGWMMFRDLANIILVVIFIAIIISQVTGFGIDNYGIKRMLPRLIALGILINLSYIIGQLAVDVSNIVGANTYGFMVSIAERFSWSGAGSALLGLTALIGGVIGGLMLAVAISGGIILLPLAMGLLGAIVSALFMFVLLGVRQVAVAVFVILAPLAFAMNILPNTAGLFKKWWNIFKTLLVLYPICALVMGAGYFGSRLMISLGGGLTHASSSWGLQVIFSFVALIVLVAPVFFIPKLVQGTFAAFGKLGTLGNKLRGTITGKASSAIQGSERYKTAQQSRARTKALAQAGQVDAIKKKGLGGVLARARARANKGINQAFPDSEVRKNLQLAGAAVISGEEREDIKKEEALFDLQNPEATLGQANTFFAEAMRSGDVAKMTAAANVMDRFGVKGIDDMASYFENLGDGNRDKAIQDFAAVTNKINGMQGRIDNRSADFGQSLKDRKDRFGDVANVIKEMDAPQLASQGGGFYKRMAGKVGRITPEMTANMNPEDVAKLRSNHEAAEKLITATLNSSSPTVRDKLTKEGRESGIQEMLPNSGGANTGPLTGGGPVRDAGGAAPTQPVHRPQLRLRPTKATSLLTGRKAAA